VLAGVGRASRRIKILLVDWPVFAGDDDRIFV